VRRIADSTYDSCARLGATIACEDHRVGRLVCLCLLFAGLPAAFAEDRIDAARANPLIDEIITTGIRERRLAELPRSATVITAEDIALAPSTNIVDLLAREANLNLRSTVGNEKFSGVDVRGQGDTYSSNVLALVDGLLLNAPDLSGADYSTIPMDQIERIEVIRGANAVRYGNGAVGGVINIITKQSQPGTRVSARARAGSYATSDAGLNASWANEVWFVGAGVSAFETDGYRDNSELEKRDFSINAGVQPVDWFGLSLSAHGHRDQYGLPGGVSPGEDPESASTPFDGGETDDDFLRAGLQLGNAASGVLNVQGRKREREVDYAFGADGAVEYPDSILQNEDRLELQYDKDLMLFGREHSFYLGLEDIDADYSRSAYNNTPDLVDAKLGDIRNTGWFVATDLRFTDEVMMSLGYRQDSFGIDSGTLSLECIDFQFPFCIEEGFVYDGEFRSWRNSALEAGLVYTPSANTNWFFSYASSFRNPNIDELVFAEEEIGPQTGDYLDLGVRQFIGRALELNLAAFYSRTEDEILFNLDPETNESENRNADEPVRRIGGEADVRWTLSSVWSFSATLGYVDAEFTKSGTTMPLVPKWTGSLGADWSPLDPMMLSVVGRYVGSRFDGNDYSNEEYAKLPAYQVVDAKLSYEWRGLQLYAGVDNLLDEEYSASAYSESYYPMPPRNYYAGITYRMSGETD